MLLPSFIQIQKINHYTGHAAGIFSLAQGFAQHEILSGGGDGVIAAWQVGKQENAKGLASIAGNVFALKLVPEMQLLVAGDLNGVIKTALRTAVAGAATALTVDVLVQKRKPESVAGKP